MTSSLPEAPASLSYQAVSTEGFPVTITMRYDDHDKALTDLVNLPQKLKDIGYKAPEIKKFGGGFQKKEKEYVEGRVCPKCGMKVVQGETKTGKKFVACETRKWNTFKKAVEGCEFIEWEESTQKPTYTSQNDDIPMPHEPDAIDRALHGEPASEAQKKFISSLIEKGQIERVDVYSLSKEEARRLLSTVKK